MENQNITLDEVLDKFSIFGLYHVKFMLLASFSFAMNAMGGFQYIFAADIEGYTCRDEGFSSDTCSSVNGTSCSGWIYDDPHSFVAEFELACQEWKRTLVGTIHCFGEIIGLLIIGPLTDRWGRQPLVVLLGVLGGVFGLAKSYIYSYWLYIVLEFLGTAFGNNYLTVCVLKLEIVSAKKRVMFSTISSVGVAVGGIIIPFAAWGIPYWRYFLRAIYTPCFLIITYILLIDESPRWLLIIGKREEAIAVIKKIAATNKVTLDADLHKLEVEDKNQQVGIRKLLKMTLSSRILLKRCMICIVWWFTSTFTTYGMSIISVSLQGNKYINFALVEVLSAPSYFIAMYVMLKFKRRNPLISTFFATSILCLVHPFMPVGYPWLSLMIYMLSKLMCSIFFCITYIYTSELFPTCTRTSMHGFCSSVGRMGSVLAPLSPLLISYWEGLPSLLFSGASLIAGLLTFLVPDTADDCLPDTVREAEDIGKKKEILAMDNLALSNDSIPGGNTSVVRTI